jgi:hypothetical protein
MSIISAFRISSSKPAWATLPTLSQKNKKRMFSTITFTGCQWLTPVILATQEAEMRRIEV